MKLRAISTAILAVTLASVFLFVQITPAQDTGLRLLTSAGMKPAVEELTPQIERSIGRRLDPNFDSSKAIQDKILAGEPFDIAILATDVIDDLVKQGKIAAGTRTEFARTGIGIGVRAGAPKPDFGTTEALKQTLLKAKAISFNPIGASSEHIREMFTRLGIADEVKSKLVLDSKAGGPQADVVEGKAEIVITLIPEIKFFEGVELAGPIPPDFQSYISFAAGISATTKNADAANALIKFITSPAAAPALEAKGMEPAKRNQK